MRLHLRHGGRRDALRYRFNRTDIERLLLAALARKDPEAEQKHEHDECNEKGACGGGRARNNGDGAAVCTRCRRS